MNPYRKNLKHLLALSLILTAADLIYQVLSLYTKAGDLQVYTRENISERLIYVWPLLLITALLILINSFFAKEEKPSPIKLSTPPVMKKAVKDAFFTKLLFIVSILLIIHGMVNGGITAVFIKAISICTECIGLG